MKEEEWMESLDRAYTMFEDRLKDGVLPVWCRSWLLYPEYERVFGENSNTVKFARKFETTAIREFEEFDEGWRVFGADWGRELSELPCDTTLQRNFIEYIKNGKPFGDGAGVLLYDGKTVLTKR